MYLPPEFSESIVFFPLLLIKNIQNFFQIQLVFITTWSISLYQRGVYLNSNRATLFSKKVQLWGKLFKLRSQKLERRLIAKRCAGDEDGLRWIVSSYIYFLFALEILILAFRKCHQTEFLIQIIYFITIFKEAILDWGNTSLFHSKISNL